MWWTDPFLSQFGPGVPVSLLDGKAIANCQEPETSPSGPVDALPLVPCRTEPVLKIRVVDLIVVNGKWLSDYTDQRMAARQRA